MNRTALACAALVAATGFAMANEVHVKKPHHPDATRDQRIYDQRLDCWRSWSARYDKTNNEECVAANAKPRLGIDIDPFWIIQDLHP